MEWKILFVAKEIKLIVIVFCLHLGIMLYVYHSLSFSYKPASRAIYDYYPYFEMNLEIFRAINNFLNVVISNWRNWILGLDLYDSKTSACKYCDVWYQN